MKNAAIIYRIKEELKRKSMNRVDLIEVTGISAASISRIFNGFQPITKENLTKIADVLSVSVDYLERGKGQVLTIRTSELKAFFEMPEGERMRYVMETADTESLDPKAYYIKVDTPKMVGGKIKFGDLLLVEPSREYKEGDVVHIYWKGKQHLVARYYEQSDGILLVPINDPDKQIYIKENQIPDIKIERISRRRTDEEL